VDICTHLVTRYGRSLDPFGNEETMTDRSLRGRLSFYDASTNWGLIAGDDGRLYAVRGDQFSGAQPKPGERVSFAPLESAGGPRATGVERLR